MTQGKKTSHALGDLSIPDQSVLRSSLMERGKMRMWWLRDREHFLPLPPTAELKPDIPVIFFTQKEKHQSGHADREHICNLTTTVYNYRQLRIPRGLKKAISRG